MTKPAPKKPPAIGLPSGMRYAGHDDDGLNLTLVRQVVSTLWTAHTQPEDLEQQIMAAVIQLREIKAGDVIEGMLAAQMIASHAAAMECYRRAMLKEQTFEGRGQGLNQANKCSRTYAALLEALNRHRGKGQQKVTVEHVHVHAGGQAVVGNVSAGGRGSPETEGQPHEQQHPPALAHAPGTALLGDFEADVEPVPRPRRARA